MHPRTRLVAGGIAALALVALVAVAGPTASAVTHRTVASGADAASSCNLPTFGPGPSYRPQIDRSDFSANVTNPLFPLKPGHTLIYSGTKDGKQALNIFATTSRTAVIDGVTTRVVQDRLYLNNALEERTADYYAQDDCGNVWYFGEDTATLDPHGHVVSREGSFHAGVHGAQPGVFMQAQPEAGRQFRQEWAPGHAEDRYTALELSTSITVPAGSFHHVLRTKEQTDLEPGVLDNKYFVKGIGEVEELAVKGPLEKLVLVEIID
jgi:hypothetical protein